MLEDIYRFELTHYRIKYFLWRFLDYMHALNLLYPQFCQVSAPKLHTSALATLYTFVTQTTPTH